MASQSFDYERQAQYDERLVMGCRTSRLGNKSMDLTYELWRGEERIGHGLSTLVGYDYEAAASIVIPAEWRRRIAEYEIIAPAAGLSRTAGGGS
jgi:acyl-CoA thioesterase FadM